MRILHTLLALYVGVLMTKDECREGLITLVVMISSILLGWFTCYSSIEKYGGGFQEAIDKKRDCEKDLPRDQSCEIKFIKKG